MAFIKCSGGGKLKLYELGTTETINITSAVSLTLSSGMSNYKYIMVCISNAESAPVYWNIDHFEIIEAISGGIKIFCYPSYIKQYTSSSNYTSIYYASGSGYMSMRTVRVWTTDDTNITFKQDNTSAKRAYRVYGLK